MAKYVTNTTARSEHSFPAHFKCAHCGVENDTTLKCSITASVNTRGGPSMEARVYVSSTVRENEARLIKDALAGMRGDKAEISFSGFSNEWGETTDSGIWSKQTLSPFVCKNCGAMQIPSGFKSKKRLGFRAGCLTVFAIWLVYIVTAIVCLANSVFAPIICAVPVSILLAFIWMPFERSRTKKANADPEKLFQLYGAAYNDQIRVDGSRYGVDPFFVGEALGKGKHQAPGDGGNP